MIRNTSLFANRHRDFHVVAPLKMNSDSQTRRHELKLFNSYRQQVQQTSVCVGRDVFGGIVDSHVIKKRGKEVVG